MLAYSGPTIVFPSDDVPTKKKEGRTWQSAVARSIWSRYSLGSTYYGFQNRDQMMLMRLYSDGRQPSDKYKDWMTGKKKEKASPAGGEHMITDFFRKGYSNVDYSIDSPAPSFKSTILSVLSNSDYKVQAVSMSTGSIAEKKKRKFRLYFDTKFKALREMAGLPLPVLPWEPQNLEELELYERLGGIKLSFEMAIEDICNHVFEISDWSSIRARGIEDEIDINFVCGKVYTCEKTGATKIKHIKPQNLVMSWIDEDRDNPTFVGHLEKVRLCDIRAKLLAEGYTIEEVMQVARSYYNTLNLAQSWDYFREYDPNTERWRWEDITVDVLEYEYCSLDTQYYTDRQTKDGNNQYFFDEESDETRSERKDYADGRKRKTDKIQNATIYCGKYIVGSSFVYDYGRQVNIMKSDYATAYCSYFFERIPGKSITERLIPIYDSLMMCRLKLQAAKWAAAPKGYSIDIAALSNINIGGAIYKPQDLISIRRQNGVQIYKTTMQQGKVVTGENSIRELEGGIGPQLQEWITCFIHDYERALELSGISRIMMGGKSINSEKGLGISELEISATNHALYPLKEGLRKWKEKAAKAIVMKTLVNIQFDEKCRDYWTKVIGEEKVAAIIDMGQTTLEELNISLESLPNDQMVQDVKMAAMQSMNAGKNGQRGMSVSDYMYVLQLLDKREIKLATWYMAVSEERAAKQKLESETAMQQQNAAMMAQAAQQAEMAKVQSAQQLAQIEVQKHAAISNIDLMKEEKIQRLKGQQTLEQIQLEGVLESRFNTEITGRI